MNGIQILERIVEEEGNCSWATSSECKVCPLGNLVRSDNGGRISCVEALNIEALSEDMVDARYKEAALGKLADLTLTSIIEAD